MSEEKKNFPKPKLWHALVVLLITILLMASSILEFDSPLIMGVDEVHAPMFLGVCAAAIMAMCIGFKWEDLEKMMLDGIYKALQSILILAIVGILVGVWIDAGVVPSMIYFGLKILSPKIFLLAVVLICSITSLATGTSWGTMASMGVAFLGISYGMGLNPAITVGAVLSGAYFGDKMSPLSDTTNLAPAMAGTDVMTHVKFMMLPTGVTYVVCLIVFLAFGFSGISGNADMSQAAALGDAIADIFTVSPLLILPPIIVIVAIALKVPAIPGITLGIFSGGILGMIFQKNCSLGSLLVASYGGFSLDASTGLEAVDNLLERGGIESMLFSISLTIIAMMFGGIMEGTGMMAVVVEQIKKLVKGPAGLVTATEITCVVSNVTMPEQYISIIIPGRMYAEEYEKMGLHPACLSNALESSGTVTSALVPWNTCGAYITSTLGLKAWSATANGGAYGPYALFNWLMPIVNIVMAYIGLTVADMNNVRLAKKKKA
ncbi:MAG: Na+/H+ antiporter NhaC [Ruminococcaceae bacterium]|jgi:NhaC family Na+:H+ antiporter|nr:Na+/H+ antiporter NhaC [Oscillospiraceae bacterium]